MRMIRLFAVVLVSVLLAPLSASPQDISWIRQFGTSTFDYAVQSAVDANGNVFVAGTTSGTLPGQSPAGGGDAFVRRYDAAGSVAWTSQFGSIASDSASDVAADGAGNVYVSGYTLGALPGQGSFGDMDAFVRRYDASGAIIWTRQFGTPGADYAWDVDSDGAGNVYVVGETAGALAAPGAGAYDMYVRRYDPDGTVAWTKQFGTIDYDGAYSVSVDALGNVFVAGYAGGVLSGQSFAGIVDAFVMRFDASGAAVWTREFGSPVEDYGIGVAADGAGGAVIAGWTEGTIPGQTSAGSSDVFVRAYDALGNARWTKQFGTAAAEWANGVAADSSGNVYLTGPTQGAFAGQTSTGSFDVFVRRLQPGGAETWTVQFGSGAADSPQGISIDSSRKLYLAGSTQGTLPGQFSAGSNDAFAAKLTQRSCIDTANPSGNETGPVSGPVHSLEPTAGPAGATIHKADCEVFVAHGL